VSIQLWLCVMSNFARFFEVKAEDLP
jgi:hypothetical protein